MDCSKYDVLSRMVDHKREYGGTLALVTGPQGSGKTTFLLRLALMMMERGEVVIWRGRTLAQWPIIWHRRPDLVNVFTPASYAYGFTKITEQGKEELEIEPQEYDSFRDLISKAEAGKLNVVYADPDNEFWWFDFLEALKLRDDIRWFTLLLDEIDDIFPEHPKGERWHRQEKVKNDVKDFRKAFISLFGAVHNDQDVDMRIRGKMQFRVYLRSSRPIQGSMVKPGVIRQLKPGEAIVEDNANFQKITYRKLEKPPYQVKVEPLFKKDRAALLTRAWLESMR